MPTIPPSRCNILPPIPPAPPIPIPLPPGVASAIAAAIQQAVDAVAYLSPPIKCPLD